MIKLTKNINEANLITHGGTFHPDDVFSTIFLNKMFPNSIVYRATQIPEKFNGNQIIYDIGYGSFDHHGPNAKMRNDKIKYSSFGLLWKEYGLSYLSKITENYEKLWQIIDEKLVMQIDGIDNGNFPKIEADYKLMDLDNVIDLFNKAWNENVDNDQNFQQACMIAELIFDRLLLKEKAKLEAQKEVETSIAQNNHQEILILDKYMPYQEFILESKNKKANDILYVIFKSNRRGYTIRAVTKELGSFESRKKFPKEWAGLRNEDLQKVTGVKTATFCHNACFICVADELTDAIKLAKLAVESGDGAKN